MKWSAFRIMLIFLLFLFSCNGKNRQPNVVIIYTDDIGYGDIEVNGAKTIPTPNINRLAQEGLQFTDGHCAASTCSPSRYALLTGEMGFRVRAIIGLLAYTGGGNIQFMKGEHVSLFLSDGLL